MRPASLCPALGPCPPRARLSSWPLLCSLWLGVGFAAAAESQRPRPMLSSHPAAELGVWSIGYTEHRTDLPGGRHVNVATGQACLIEADGSGRRLLAPDLDRAPDTWTQFAGWSPDGNLAVVICASNSPANAAWEEEHRTFRHSEGWLIDTLLLDLKRGERRNVTAVGRVSTYNSGLFFWPNQPERLGFTAIIGGVSRPYSMGLDGQGKKDLTDGQPEFTYGFEASKDGRRICYHKSYQVYLADADGSGAVQVKTGNPFNFAPQWSPDGEWVLFVSGEHYDCHPHVIRADGTGLRKVASRAGYRGVTEFLDVPDFHGGSSDVPVWSADGRWIYFTALAAGAVELFRAGRGSDGPIEQLTHTPTGVTHYHPKPSPDGRWVCFGSTRAEGRRQLFLMPAPGGEVRQLTHVPAGWAAMHAHWNPRRR